MIVEEGLDGLSSSTIIVEEGLAGSSSSIIRRRGCVHSRACVRVASTRRVLTWQATIVACNVEDGNDDEGYQHDDNIDNAMVDSSSNYILYGQLRWYNNLILQWLCRRNMTDNFMEIIYYQLLRINFNLRTSSYEENLSFNHVLTFKLFIFPLKHSIMFSLHVSLFILNYVYHLYWNIDYHTLSSSHTSLINEPCNWMCSLPIVKSTCQNRYLELHN